MDTKTSTAATALPEELKPSRISGAGINVVDLEAQRAWYEEKLGMRTVFTYERDGAVFEYIMGYGERGGAIVALLKSDRRPEGRNGFSRVILQAPNAKALSEALRAQGIKVNEVVPDVAYFLADPEGNPIELYTPPAR